MGLRGWTRKLSATTTAEKLQGRRNPARVVFPQRLNSRKNDQIGSRQISTAQAFCQAGLLTAAGWKTVLAAKR